MIKQKLINKRRKHNLTQEEVAFRLGIPTSSYSRRENGIIKISKKEWDTLAQVLNTTIANIYESDDGVYVFSGEAVTTTAGTKTSFNEFVVKTLKKYIKRLEKENTLQKQEIKRLSQLE